MDAKDRRVKMINEILSGIKVMLWKDILFYLTIKERSLY